MLNFKQWLENINFHNSVYLFRGIGGKPNPLDRLGRWWSTNPYYSIRYGGGKEGQIFVAKMDKQAIEEGLVTGIIVDATQDEYPNYIFKQHDPSQARRMTAQEIQQFKTLANPDNLSSNPNRIGGETFRQLWGQEAIDAAYKVFGENFMDQEVPYKREKLSVRKKKFKSPPPEKLGEPMGFGKPETGFVAHLKKD